MLGPQVTCFGQQLDQVSNTGDVTPLASSVWLFSLLPLTNTKSFHTWFQDGDQKDSKRAS